MANNRKFYSKTLLFGEYALIFGSPALSVPYTNRYGYFEFSENPDTKSLQSNKALWAFLPHLKNLVDQKRLSVAFDVGHFEGDLRQGLSFKSNIPIGYGLGSSGALVAAVYDRYAVPSDVGRNYGVADLNQLKLDFSLLEAFFHGTSSGLDPLICYLQKPVLLDAHRKIKIVEYPSFSSPEKGGIFLIDSGFPGKTQPLVDYFMKQSQQASFMKMIQQQLIPVNQQAIDCFLGARWEALLETVKQVSVLSLQYFSPMIPDQMKPLWRNGIENEAYYLKLCGSGGGGMMLGFTSDLSNAARLLNAYAFSIIQRF